MQGNAQVASGIKPQFTIQMELEFNSYRGAELNVRGVKGGVYEDDAGFPEDEGSARTSDDLEHFMSLVEAWNTRGVLA